MGKHRNGLVGSFSGKVGPIIGSSWKSIDVIRARAKRLSKKSTPAKDAQRAKFKVVANFIRTMRDLFDVSFPDFSDKMTARNNAVSNILTSAISGEFPDYSIKFNEVAVARGGLTKPHNPAVVYTEPGTLSFTWEDNTIVGSAKEDDQAILVAYCEELKEPIFTIKGGNRSAEHGTMNVRFFSGKKVHTWIAFISADMKKKFVSDSLYTGAIMMP